MDFNNMVCMTLFFMISIIILLTFMSTRFNKRKRSSRKNLSRSAKLPSGSLGWPFFGETLEFISCAYSPHPESFMNKRRLLYGKVFKSHIFGSPTIVSTDAEVSRVVLQSDAKAFVPSYPKSLTELMGKSSILLINGGLHRRVHGLIGAFFKSPLLKSQITTDMHKYVQHLMSGWQDNQLIFIQDETKHIVFQILVRVLIGLEPGEEMQFLKHNFQEFIAGLMSLPVKLPGCRLYKSLQAKKRMVMLVEKIIKEKKKKRRMMMMMMNSNTSDHQNTPKDVIDVLLNDNSNQLNDDLISDNMIDLMIPGEDSVPILVTLAIKYLSDCPPALKQLEDENMQLKQQKSSLSWTDYLSLTFTQDVITETLRLGNIISGIIRMAMKDMEIKGHFIPKGWCVFTYFRSVHLDESIHENPHKFNPWRWKDKDMNSCGFTAFGGGQRLCPGLDLARLEASIFLHHLVTNFTWVAEEDQVVNFPTVRMKRRMPIRVKRKVET
ncbi:cytochrome P450 90D2 [Dioscorea cayenensis subsp. rotundata]|uniref:Cytochrome P450 90D2 n=1 Tax=Dioscorea cayennensis subsp. rotundata TaxID=55577 RepID=A0AB40CVP4_DIOCR|nr:cytochrome P450 90D2 [Dioscorea cayenensis subsp. rotundata]